MEQNFYLAQFPQIKIVEDLKYDIIAFLTRWVRLVLERIGD